MKTNSDRFKAMLKDKTFKQNWRNGRDIGLQCNVAVCSAGGEDASLVYTGSTDIWPIETGNFVIISRDTAALLDFDAPVLVVDNKIDQEGLSVEYKAIDTDTAMQNAVTNCLSTVLQWQPLPDGFEDAVAYCMRAVGDDSRPMLHGILVNGGKMVAADGFRMHIVKDVDLPDMRFQTDAVATFLKNAEPDEYALTTNGYVYFRNSKRGLYLACAHTDQNYPPWESICPKLTTPYTDNSAMVSIKALADVLAKFPRHIIDDHLNLVFVETVPQIVFDGKTDTAALHQYVDGVTVTGATNAYYNILFLRDALPPTDLATLYTGKVDAEKGYCRTPATLIGGRYTAILMPMHRKEEKK